MRKIVLFIVLFLGFYQGAFATDVILYPSSNNSYNLYEKTATGTDNGIQKTSQTSFAPAYSPDGNFIYYVNGGNVWRKNANDSLNGAGITNNGCVYLVQISVSPNSNDLVYTNTCDGNKLYKINAKTSSIDNGTAITSQESFYPTYNNDYLFYTTPLGGGNREIIAKTQTGTDNGNSLTPGGSTSFLQIFASVGGRYVYGIDSLGSNHIRKIDLTLGINGTNSGVVINSNNSYYVLESNDGLSVYYVNNSAGGILYKKTSTGTDNGSSITTTYPDAGLAYSVNFIPPIPPASCSDGIKNQDETGIDVGGICGNNTFKYTGTGAVGTNVSCSTKTYTTDTSVSWYTDYGTLTPTAWSPTDVLGQYGYLGFIDTANNGIDTDYFKGIYFADGSYLPHGVMTYNSAYVANVEYFDERSTPLSEKDPRIKILSKRNGQYRGFNIMKVSGSGADIDGATHANGGLIINGSSQQTSSFSPCTTNEDNTCTIRFPETVQYADLHIYSGFTGVKFGNSTSSVNKVACSNSSYSCEWRQYGTGSICSGLTFDPTINAYRNGNCGITSEGYCAPTSVYRVPNAWEKRVLDGSGNTVGIINDPLITSSTSTSQAKVIDDVFSCPKYTDWTDFPSCLVQIVRNGYNVVKTSINSSTGDGQNTIVGTVKQIGSSGSTTIDFGPVSNEGVNFADNVFRGVWNKSFDNDEPLTRFSRMALFMSLMLVFLATVLIITFIGVRKK